MTETASAPETGPTAIADLPTGEPIPSSAPADPEAPEPKPTARRTSLAALLKTLPSDADAFVSHLQRCLATPAGIDTLLLFICYTSRLTGATLANLSQYLLRRSSSSPYTPRDLIALVLTLPGKTAVVVEAAGGGNPAPPLAALAARLAAVLATRLKNLGSLASEARTIARLWSLVGMYFWAKRLVLSLVAARGGDGSEKAAAAAQPGGKLAALVSWAQLVACAGFQVLENGAYLSGRGVLGWTPAQQGRAYVVGARFLGVFTAIELGRLLAEFVARRGQDYSAAGPDERAKVDALRRSAAINLAWAPLALHWSVEGGFLSDLMVGAGGCIPGLIQMTKLWRETA